MANYTIGDMIYDTRVARGYSQEELCFGICSTSSLSRIENNSQVPTKRVFDALMQRLGVSNSIYSAYISKGEMELYQLTQKLTSMLGYLNFEEVKSLITELESKIGKKHFLERQYMLFAKASICKHEGGSLEEMRKLLLEAIHITMPDFEENNLLKRKLLTFDEIIILNSIAINFYDGGKKSEGLKILYKLKEYMEKRIVDEEEKAKKYPMILYNIVQRIGADYGRYIDVIELCDLGIEYCIKFGKLLALPYLVNDKACAAAELGHLEEAKELFGQAISIFQVCRKDDFAKRIKMEVETRYQLQL